MNVDAVLIAGPTASGKSAAALALAEQVGGVIVNADSMQVYAELRALTARPSQADEARVPHRLYGHVRVRERYSAGRYQNESARALEEALKKKLLPIFVGGTGLYFAALTDGLSPIPSVPPEVRASVRQRFETLGREAFFADFAARDPATAANLKVSDTQRLMRAARFVVSPPREILSERIDRRFTAMVHNGALAEASVLQGLDASLPAAKALGLPQLWRHLAGNASLEAAIAEAQIATRQYAKRQLTWFRNRMRGWKWLESDEISNLITSIRQELS